MPDTVTIAVRILFLLGTAVYLGTLGGRLPPNRRSARRSLVLGCLALLLVPLQQAVHMAGYPIDSEGWWLAPGATLVGFVLLWDGVRRAFRRPGPSPERRRAEAALRDAESRFRGLAHIAPDAILATDHQFRITYWNRAAETIFGYGRNEILGRSLLDLAPTLHRQSHRQILSDILGPQVGSYVGKVIQIKGLTKDGREIPIEFSAVAWGSGERAQLAAIIRDVSQRHRTESLLRGIAETQSATVGESFFPALTEFLAKTLNAKLVTVGTLVEPAGERLRTIAVHRDGSPAPNFEYALAGSPCEQVLVKHLCLFEHDVASQFPDDHALLAEGAESYAGAALLDSKGKARGVLLVVCNARIANPVETTLLLRIFAVRAAAELERLDALNALRDSEQRFRDFAEAASDWIWETDAEHRFTYIGGRFYERTGRHPEEVIGKTRFEFADSATIAAEPEKWGRHQAILNARQPFRGLVYPVRRPDGLPCNISVNGKPVFDADGRFIGYRGTGRDVTERLAAEEAQRLSASVFEAATEAIVVTDADNRIKAINPAFTEITGYTADEAIGKRPSLLSSGRHDSEFYHALWEKLTRDGRWSGEIWNRRKSGEIYAEWLSIVAIKDGRGQVKEYVAVFSDFTQRKRDEETIRRQANFDGLTGLPNRSLFHDRLAHALASADRNDRKLAVMFVDLDHFKRINDTLGHFAGDTVMQEAAERIRGCLRESDTVGRFGGDEFTILIGDLAKPGDVEPVARKILDQLAKPFLAAGQEVSISGSIGLAIYPDDAEDAATLLRHADTAMYQAKDSGRNGLCFYIPALNRVAQEHLRLERELRHALERGELDLHYQPIVDFATRRPIGAEALLRWNHPVHGLLTPERFLPLAEETGLILPIGAWVLDTACHEAAGWAGNGSAPLTLSVNLSGRQFRDRHCVGAVREALARSGFKADRLVLEIPEALLLDDNEHIAQTLSQLRAMGVKLAIDNFGTGFSSLGFLRRYPIQILKVDRSFVANLHTNHDDAVAAEAIIAIARSLGFQVMGEGLERDEHRTFLQARTCSTGQGYLFSKPLSAGDFDAYLRDNTLH